jgi:hypothetical protein
MIGEINCWQHILANFTSLLLGELWSKMWINIMVGFLGCQCFEELLQEWRIFLHKNFPTVRFHDLKVKKQIHNIHWKNILTSFPCDLMNSMACVLRCCAECKSARISVSQAFSLVKERHNDCSHMNWNNKRLIRFNLYNTILLARQVDISLQRPTIHPPSLPDLGHFLCTYKLANGIFNESQIKMN